MIRLAVLVTALALPAGAAAAPSAELLVVGKSSTLSGPARVALKPASAGKGCRVAGATPIAALLRTDLRVKVRDYAACSRRPADATGLYVRSVEGQREKGRGGWVYKIGNRAPSTGAGDLASRVRGGDRVLWFWCRNGSDGCQRTLAVTPQRAAAAVGEALPVTVTAYDDDGRGIPAVGATVRLGTATAVTGADGVATLTVAAGAPVQRLTAAKAGLVRSFTERVRVG